MHLIISMKILNFQRNIFLYDIHPQKSLTFSPLSFSPLLYILPNSALLHSASLGTKCFFQINFTLKVSRWLFALQYQYIYILICLSRTMTLSQKLSFTTYIICNAHAPWEGSCWFYGFTHQSYTKFAVSNMINIKLTNTLLTGILAIYMSSGGYMNGVHYMYNMLHLRTVEKHYS